MAVDEALGNSMRVYVPPAGPAGPLGYGTVDAQRSVATIQAIAARLGLRPQDVVQQYLLGRIEPQYLMPTEVRALQGLAPSGVSGIPTYPTLRRDLRDYERARNVRMAEERQALARDAQAQQRRVAEVRSPQGRQRLANAMAQGSPVASARERRMAQARWAATEAPENLGVAFQGQPAASPQAKANYAAGQSFANMGRQFSLNPDNQAALAAAFSGWGPSARLPRWVESEAQLDQIKRAMVAGGWGPSTPPNGFIDPRDVVDRGRIMNGKPADGSRGSRNAAANSRYNDPQFGPLVDPNYVPTASPNMRRIPWTGGSVAGQGAMGPQGPQGGSGAPVGAMGPAGPQGPPGARALRTGPMGPTGPVAPRGMSVKGAKQTVDGRGYTRIQMPHGAIKKMRAQKKQADLKNWYDTARRNEEAAAAAAEEKRRQDAMNGGASGTAAPAVDLAAFDKAGQQAADRVNGVYADAAARYKALMDQNTAMSQQAQASLNRDMMNRYSDMSKSVASGNGDLAAQGFAPTADMQQAANLQLQALQNAGQAQNTWASNMGTLANTVAADRLGSIDQSKAAYLSGIAGQVAASKANAVASAAGGGGGGGGGYGSSGGNSDLFGPSSFSYAEKLTKLDSPTEYQRNIDTTTWDKSMPKMQQMMRGLRNGGNPLAMKVALPKGRGGARRRQYLNQIIPLYNKQPTYNLQDVNARRDAVYYSRGDKRVGY